MLYYFLMLYYTGEMRTTEELKEKFVIKLPLGHKTKNYFRSYLATIAVI